MTSGAGAGSGGLGMVLVVVPGSGLGGVGCVVVVVGLGSVLVVVVVVGVGSVLVVDGSELVGGVVVVGGAAAAVVVVVTVIAPADPAAATLGVVVWPSTVGSVWVCVRPGNTLGLAFGFVVAPAVCLFSGFLAVAAVLAGAGLWRGCLSVTKWGWVSTDAPPDTCGVVGAATGCGAGTAATCVGAG